MNFFRTLPSKIVQVSHLKVGTTKKRQFGQNYETSLGDRLDGRFKPLKECSLNGNDILNQSTSTISRHDSLNESYGSYDRKRSRDYSDDDHLDAKRHLFDKNHSSILKESNRNSFSEHCRRKRIRHCDGNDDDYEGKKRRLNDASVQFAIKQPSQYTDPNRKILESVFDGEITAEGWKKKSDGFEYHTEVRGKCFYEVGHSVVDAREHVAATALKNLCNFKRENIFWPDTLLPFQLNQHFADEIERMVKTKFDRIMESHFRYKVLAGIVMTTHEMPQLDNAKVVAFGTGSKCMSNINEDEDGTILHDMHAEVLARRSFVRFLCQQLHALRKNKFSVFQFEGKEIILKKWIKFHLYVTSVPCGDARVFSLRGLNHVKMEAKMGCLRFKKIGGTEPMTENTFRVSSMSCSDKIVRWNVLGLQGSHLAKFIKPIYLESIVLGSRFTPVHLYRAIGGRLTESLTDLPHGYSLNKPFFESTSLIETDENFATTSSMDYGVCWNDGPVDENAPEILNLLTGLTIRGEKSIVSKLSLMNIVKSINQKLPVRSDEGVENFKKVKEQFYSALKRKNYGSWERCSEAH